MENAKKRFSFEESLRFCTKKQPSSEKSGPRAALYEAKMGKSHKRATKMQSDSSKKSHFQSPSFNFANVVSIFSQKSKFFKIAFTIVFCALIVVLNCYGPAKNYYIQLRDNAKIEAEYSAVENRNQLVKQKVDALSTDEGIEAYAHSELGYVKKGEGSAYVVGKKEESSTQFIEYVDPNKIKAPNEWYSTILDFIFGYNNS